ncbi:hypothetical protein [Asaia sp. HN010]|uniref:hypothetical protein n=1 Tax=Asaia sp. HN010 TaxID=3081233 RepID=UPI0038CF8B34
MRHIRPNCQSIGGAKYGMISAYSGGSEAQFELRAFAEGWHGYEDPVTGSLNAAIAQWLMERT